MDGIYTREEAEAGEIPEGFEAGDLKPHIIRYIPEGDYVLEEVTTDVYKRQDLYLRGGQTDG